MGEPGVSSGHLMMMEQPAASAAAILRTACVARAHAVGRLAQDLAALKARHPAPRLEAFVDGCERLVEVVPGDVAELADGLLVAGCANNASLEALRKGRLQRFCAPLCEQRQRRGV